MAVELSRKGFTPYAAKKGEEYMNARQRSHFRKILESRNRDRERKLIKKIDETIARIDANEYGYCESCGVEIGLKRLEARPTATLCIDCKTLDELRERQVAK